MIVITQRSLILEVADRWEKQYGKGQYGQDKIEILKTLRALDLSVASAEQVNKVIGNSSWTDLHCSECRDDVLCVIRVGEEPDYESVTAYLCVDCAEKAAKMFDEVRG